jgi:hypothetical protein
MIRHYPSGYACFRCLFGIKRIQDVFEDDRHARIKTCPASPFQTVEPANSLVAERQVQTFYFSKAASRDAVKTFLQTLIGWF